MEDIKNIDPIQVEFNAVIDEYNKEYSKAKTPEEQDAIQEKYEKKIDEAEKVMEKAYEERQKAEDEALAKEAKEAEDALKKLEEDDAKRLELEDKFRSMKKQYRILSQKNLSKMYLKKDNIEFAEYLGIKDLPKKEIDIVGAIMDYLNNNGKDV